MGDRLLVRIEPAAPGDQGVRVIVQHQGGSRETWKALAVEINLDTTQPPAPPVVSG